MKMFMRNPRVLAKIALKNKLYHSPMWCLYDILTFRANRFKSDIKVCMCMDNGIIKGVCCYDISQYDEWGGASLQVYVLPDYRQEGIGRKLVHAMISNLNEEELEHVCTGTGVEGSSTFWSKMKREGFIPQ